MIQFYLSFFFLDSLLCSERLYSRLGNRNQARSKLFIHHLFLSFSFPITLYHIQQRERKCRAANNSDRPRHRIIKLQPVQIRFETFFEKQHQHRTRISDGIDHRNKEADIPPDAETGNEPVEEDRLKTQIREVKAEALNEQSRQRRKLQRLIIERDKAECKCSGNNQREQDGQHLHMTLDQCKGSKNR